MVPWSPDTSILFPLILEILPDPDTEDEGLAQEKSPFNERLFPFLEELEKDAPNDAVQEAEKISTT